jgi:hypothetical protein
MLTRPQAIDSRATAFEAAGPFFDHWFMPHADLRQAQELGLRLQGGGTHQSKTMMFAELVAYWSNAGAGTQRARYLIVEANVLNKRTASTRLHTFRHLNALYAIEAMPAITKVLAALWQLDSNGKPLLALLCALARDPLLRDTAEPVLGAPVGVPVRWPVLAATLEQRYPGRFSAKMLKSLGQNCASTWTQSGHLQGAVRKQRIRAEATPYAAAYAALIAAICGFGGPALLESAWLRVLDGSPGRDLDLLRQAQARGLLRIRSAGDVLEIAVRQPMAAALKVGELVQLR